MKPDQGVSDGLKIRISGLSPGTHEFRFTVSPSDLNFGKSGAETGRELEAGFDAPVEITVRLEKAARQIIVRTGIETSGMFPCDRCLAQFRQPVRTGYSVVYVQDEESAGKFPPEDIRIIRPDTTVIDLAADVREMIKLSIPLKLLCREECRGLCRTCGADLNAGDCGCRPEASDGRWQTLEKLLKH